MFTQIIANHFFTSFVLIENIHYLRRKDKTMLSIQPTMNANYLNSQNQRQINPNFKALKMPNSKMLEATKEKSSHYLADALVFVAPALCLIANMADKFCDIFGICNETPKAVKPEDVKAE